MTHGVSEPDPRQVPSELATPATDAGQPAEWDGTIPEGFVKEAFSRDAYSTRVPLHRMALAGLEALNRQPDFDPETTHAIILLHDGNLATVAPLNYNDDREAVLQDLVQHLKQLAESFGIPLTVVLGASLNGGTRPEDADAD